MFENSLIDLDKKNKRGLRWWLMPIALVIHLVAGGALLFAQYWNVPPVEEPPINVVFVNTAPPPPPPPPPPPAAAPKQIEVPKEVPHIQPNEPVQPVQVPEKVPEPTNTPADAGVEGGVEGGVAGGVVGGVIGGVVGGVVGGTPGGVVGGQEDAPLRVGGDVSRPEIITQVKPVYTELARRARVNGTVIVEAIIDQQGNVTNVRVLKGQPMGLDKAAVDAVQRWKFKPAMLAGKPVKVYYVLTVNFQVQ